MTGFKGRYGNILPILFFMLIFSGIFNACYYDYGLSPKDLDVVITFYKGDIDFSKYKTYAMPDEIEHIIQEGEEDNVDTQFDALILEEIVKQMGALGYTRQTNPALIPDRNFDLVLSVAATSSTNMTAYYNYYWGGYWGYWGYGPGWGVYYPPYWGISNVVEYRTGTLLINLIDPDLSDEANKQLGSIWIGTINGLLDDTPANVRIRLKTEIGRCFAQSPYLGVSN